MNPNPAPFVVGAEYDRSEISDQIGGSYRLYLPTSGGVVVCGCFDPDPRFNPGAPAVVVFGEGDFVEENARLVAWQPDPIPVFLRAPSGRWAYEGRYQCTGLSTGHVPCRAAEAANPARGVIRGILTFDRISD